MFPRLRREFAHLFNPNAYRGCARWSGLMELSAVVFSFLFCVSRISITFDPPGWTALGMNTYKAFAHVWVGMMLMGLLIFKHFYCGSVHIFRAAFWTLCAVEIVCAAIQHWPK